jgi:hypothetical protein
LIVYHINGKSVWTILVITFSRGHICQHSGISVVLYIFFCYCYKNHTQKFWNDLHSMFHE